MGENHSFIQKNKNSKLLKIILEYTHCIIWGLKQKKERLEGHTTYKLWHNSETSTELYVSLSEWLCSKIKTHLN